MDTISDDKSAPPTWQCETISVSQGKIPVAIQECHVSLMPLSICFFSFITMGHLLLSNVFMS